MSRNQIEALLDRYIKGETSTEENALVERWLEENGNSNTDWTGLDQPGKDEWLSSVFGDIKNTIRGGEAKVIQLPQKKNFLWRSVAAAAAILIIFSVLYQEWPALRSRLHPVQLTALQVPANQKKEITLADGSQVWVNAGSEIKYPKGFTGKVREVYLSGEAYFDIAHDSSKPFIIHTGKLVTTVLGTAFNIKEDKSKNTIEVTVTRGKVSVANGEKLLGVLMPNQQISFNTSKAEAVKGTVDADLVIAWQQSAFHFDDVSFEDAVSQLRQRFKVKINFANDKLKGCRFTGTSLNGEKLDNVLNVICAFNNATYQTKLDGSILIDGAGCK
jgi:ferric-dicitrate binding protein FerR (iron transport regulator)